MEPIHGQARAKAIIKDYLRARESCAFLFHGPTGTGKTMSVHNLAESLGVDRSPIGGFDELSGGEQHADAVRALASSFRYRPMAGNWRLVVVNDCDRMSQQAEAIWLDILDDLPPRVVICFTTRELGKLNPPLIDRCRSIEFVANARDIQKFAKQIWTQRVPEVNPPDAVMSAGCRPGCPPSYRRAVSDVKNAIIRHNSDPHEAIDLDPRFWLVADERTVRACVRADQEEDARGMMESIQRELPGTPIQLARSVFEVARGGSLPSGVEIVD